MLPPASEQQFPRMAEPSSSQSQPPPQRLQGERKSLLLGRYEVGKLLGHGNFAKVYHARNALTGESVAIKVLDKEKILKGGLVAHIKCEIAILRRVQHPNIVQLFEVMATCTKIYFDMEYVRGELFACVAKGRLREDVARRYFQQPASASPTSLKLCAPSPTVSETSTPGSTSSAVACKYAHRVFESWLHLAQYCTWLCKDETSCNCRVCFFALGGKSAWPLFPLPLTSSHSQA